MFFKKIFADEKGQSAVIAGIAIFMVIAMSALVLDIGLVHIQSSREQNAADAAALAGATLLPVAVTDSDAQAAVKALVREYAVKNGIPDEDVADDKIVLDDIKDSKFTSVRVELTSEVGFGFARVLGFVKTDVTKAAKAQVEPAVSNSEMVPLGVEESAFGINKLVNFVVKKGGGDGEAGFYGVLDLDELQGGGAKDYNSWLAYGYGGYLETGIELPVEPGNMAGPTYSAFLQRYGRCSHIPSCVSGVDENGEKNYEEDCPRVVIIVVYKVVEANANMVKTVEIVGFAPFILEQQEDKDEIICTQIGDIFTQDGESSETAPAYGLYKITLVE
jgi:Flp pilus assembly protein TadG